MSTPRSNRAVAPVHHSPGGSSALSPHSASLRSESEIPPEVARIRAMSAMERVQAEFAAKNNRRLEDVRRGKCGFGGSTLRPHHSHMRSKSPVEQRGDERKEQEFRRKLGNNDTRTTWERRGFTSEFEVKSPRPDAWARSRSADRHTFQFAGVGAAQCPMSVPQRQYAQVPGVGAYGKSTSVEL